MFGKKKNEPSPASAAETAENAGNTENTESTVQFEKNIKTLWIYTTLFCLFALVLIVVSSVIQSRINSRAEYYQDQYESTKTTSQSAIKNIRDENDALKKDLEGYKARADELEKQAEQDALLIQRAAALAENAEYLVMAQDALYSGGHDNAKKFYSMIDPEQLSEDMLAVYDSLKERLG